MKKLTWVFIFLLIGVLTFAGRSWAQNFKEGKWTITTVTKVEGMEEEMAEAMAAMDEMSAEEKAMMEQMMGGMGVQMNVNSQGVTTTVTQCLSGQSPVPDISEDQNCQVTHTTKGNTVNFKIICSNSESTGQMTYSGDTMKGKVTSHQMVDGKKQKATMEMSGQYVGPCS